MLRIQGLGLAMVFEFGFRVLGLRGLGGFAVLIMVFEFRNYLGLD